MKKITAYIDTMFRGKMNAGLGMFYFAIEYLASDNNVYTKTVIDGYKDTTNNRVAILAVIEMLETLKGSCDIDININSNYVVETMSKKRYVKWITQGWKSNNKDIKNKDLWQRLLDLDKQHIIKWNFLEKSTYTSCMRLQVQRNLTKIEYKEDVING